MIFLILVVSITLVLGFVAPILVLYLRWPAPDEKERKVPKSAPDEKERKVPKTAYVQLFGIAALICFIWLVVWYFGTVYTTKMSPLLILQQSNILNALTRQLPLEGLLGGIIAAGIVTVIGQRLAHQLESDRKNRDKELEDERFRQAHQLELRRSIRERQYDALQQTYNLHAALVEIWRQIPDPLVARPSGDSTMDDATRTTLLAKSLRARADLDALIMRICSEFVPITDDPTELRELEVTLGLLRQCVKGWQEHIEDGRPLGFAASSVPAYVIFKTTLSHVTSFMIERLTSNEPLPPVERIRDRSAKLLLRILDNRYEQVYGQTLHKLGESCDYEEYRKVVIDIIGPPPEVKQQ